MLTTTCHPDLKPVARGPWVRLLGVCLLGAGLLWRAPEPAGIALAITMLSVCGFLYMACIPLFEGLGWCAFMSELRSADGLSLMIALAIPLTAWSLWSAEPSSVVSPAVLAQQNPCVRQQLLAHIGTGVVRRNALTRAQAYCAPAEQARWALHQAQMAALRQGVAPEGLQP